MTKDEILTLSGEVVAALWPDWWPVREAFCTDCCWGDRCDEPRHFYRPNCPKCLGKGKYPAPPPDLTEPANFLRALMLTAGLDVPVWIEFCPRIGRRDRRWHGCVERKESFTDTPELALLLALVDYVRRRKEEP